MINKKRAVFPLQRIRILFCVACALGSQSCTDTIVTEQKNRTTKNISEHDGTFQYVYNNKAVESLKLTVGLKYSIKPEIEIQNSTFSVNPALPEGLSINEITAEISGEPKKASKEAKYIVTGTDDQENEITAELTLSVAEKKEEITTEKTAANPPPVPPPTPEEEPITIVLSLGEISSVELYEGESFSAELPSHNYPAGSNISYSVDPELPNGFTLDTATGQITGTAENTNSSADYTITVSDGQNSASAMLSIRTIAAPDGYIRIPESLSGLGYAYFIMRYEASLESGTASGAAISSDEQSLARCLGHFHINGDPFHSSCGSLNTNDAKVQSAENAAPLNNLSFNDAYAACRNSSNAEYIFRLPTYEEWVRIHNIEEANYGTVWSRYSGGGGTDCQVSGSAVNTGIKPNCQNALTIFDTAGNLSEWIDARMLSHDLNTEGLGRFSYAPTSGRILAEGINNQYRTGSHYSDFKFHEISPTSPLALTLGADYTIPASPYEDAKQYGYDVQRWVEASQSAANIGFRCVGFPRKRLKEDMAVFSLPRQSVHDSSDLPADPAAWDIPENKFIGDQRSSKITIQGDVAGGGSIKLNWKPWSKIYCLNADCNSQSDNQELTYHIYRWKEPNFKSERLSQLWGLAGAGSVYTQDTAINPFLVDNQGNRVFTPIASIEGCNNTNTVACEFIDQGDDFSELGIYLYLMVVSDSEGNEVFAQVQRFRSPYYAGVKNSDAAVSFRMEPKYRRAALFLVDETYQNAQSVPQNLSYVPMHQSGFDRDFFIGKYDASVASGTDANDGTAAGGPAQHDGSGGWVSDSAICHDTFSQTGTYAAECGSFGANSTGTILKHESDASVYYQRNYGTFWRACHNSTFSSHGANYFLRLPTHTEYFKAMDWGDTDFDGDFDVNPFNSVGDLVRSIESAGGAADTCATHSTERANENGNRTGCSSRYGVQGQVGNRWNVTTGQQYSLVGLDDGIDGLLLDFALRWDEYAGGASGTGFISFNLLKGMPDPIGSDTWQVRRNDDRNMVGDGIGNSSGHKMIFPAGGWFANSSGGRYHIWTDLAPSANGYGQGSVRCGY